MLSPQKKETIIVWLLEVLAKPTVRIILQYVSILNQPLYTFNVHNVMCQLCLHKAEKAHKE